MIFSKRIMDFFYVFAFFGFAWFSAECYFLLNACKSIREYKKNTHVHEQNNEVFKTEFKWPYLKVKGQITSSLSNTIFNLYLWPNKALYILLLSTTWQKSICHMIFCHALGQVKK